MNIYVALVIIIYLEYFFICALVSHKNEKISLRRKKLFLIIVTSEMFLIAVLRNKTVGIDSMQYYSGYLKYSGLSFSEIFTAKLSYPYNWEPLYFFMVKLLGFFRINYNVFLAVVALLIYVPIAIRIFYYSENPGLSYIVFFMFNLYAYSLGLNRQMIATSICLLAVKYVREKKLVKFLALIVIAFFFHKTAVCMIPLYFMVNNFAKIKKYIWIGFPISLILLFAGQYFINEILFSVVKIYSGYLIKHADLKVESSGLMFILLMSIYVVVIYHLKRNSKLGFKDQLAICAVPFACIFQALGYTMEIVGRINIYYLMLMLFLIPNLATEYFKGKNRHIVCFIIALIGIVIAIYRLPRMNDINPYLFFWQRM